MLSTIGAVATRLDELARIGLRVFARVLLLALPFLAILALVWFTTLAGHDVNYYLAERPPEWRRALLAAWIVAAGFGFVAAGAVRPLDLRDADHDVPRTLARRHPEGQ